MKTLIFIIIILLTRFCGLGQKLDTINLNETTKEHRAIPGNSIYLELGGQAIFISLNYERIFYHGGNFYLSGRTGIGDMPSFYNTLSFPLLANGIYQVSDRFLCELGIGLSLTYTFWPDSEGSGGLFGSASIESGSFFDPLLTGVAGIRIQGKKGFLFRLCFTPLIELTKDTENGTLYKQFNTNKSFIPYVGMSFGYSFNVKK